MLLPEVLDLRAASSLVAELLARRGRDIDMDASKVYRIGGQCLQVLLAAQTCWLAEKLSFRFVYPSRQFTDGLGLLGASSLASITGA